MLPLWAREGARAGDCGGDPKCSGYVQVSRFARVPCGLHHRTEDEKLAGRKRGEALDAWEERLQKQYEEEAEAAGEPVEVPVPSRRKKSVRKAVKGAKA